MTVPCFSWRENQRKKLLLSQIINRMTWEVLLLLPREWSVQSKTSWQTCRGLYFSVLSFIYVLSYHLFLSSIVHGIELNRFTLVWLEASIDPLNIISESRSVIVCHVTKALSPCLKKRPECDLHTQNTSPIKDTKMLSFCLSKTNTISGHLKHKLENVWSFWVLNEYRNVEVLTTDLTWFIFVCQLKGAS